MASVPAWRNSSPFKIEFYSDAGGKPRRHRARFYPTTEGMQKAGQRWEGKGPDYWCRYWNGLNTWTTRRDVPTSLPTVLTRVVEMATAELNRRRKEKRS